MKVAEGDGAVLKVVIAGNPEPAIVWHFEGTQLMSSSSREILSNGSLVIASTAPRHSGAYQLIAENIHGTSEVEFKLFIVPSRAPKVQEIEEAGKVDPVDLEVFGEYVSNNHWRSNKGFKKQFSVTQPCEYFYGNVSFTFLHLEIK